MKGALFGRERFPSSGRAISSYSFFRRGRFFLHFISGFSTFVRDVLRQEDFYNFLPWKVDFRAIKEGEFFPFLGRLSSFVGGVFWKGKT